MHPQFSIPTSIAMEIADLSNLKFNEAVAKGYYAPRVSGEAGKSRAFDDLEMFGLYVMGELLRLGFRLPVAASRAASARDVLERHPSAASIWISYGPDGDSVWNDGIPKTAQPQASIVFHIDAVRATIDKRLRDHARQLKKRVEGLIERVDTLSKNKGKQR